MEKAALDISYGRLVTIPQTEIDRRIGCLRSLMQERDYGLILVLEPDDGGYRGWLTGTYRMDRFSGGGLVIPLKGPVIIINGNRMVSTRKEEFENGNWKEQHFPYHYYETDNFDVQAINRIMDGKNRIGTIHGERMRVSLYDFLTEKLKGFSFEDVTLEIEKIKAMKSEEELRVMSELSRMADRIFAGAESIIEAGYNMQEIAVALRKSAYGLGCYGNDNGISTRLHLSAVEDGKKKGKILSSGRLTEGDRVDMSICCVGQDSCYCMMARSFLLHIPPSEMTLRLWNAARGAQIAAAELLKPGRTIREAHKAANRILGKWKMKQDESDFIHGIGYSMNERPRITDASQDWRLEKNMILVLAPSASNEYGTICCGDKYAVSEQGGYRLNGYPVGLRCL